MKIFTFIFARGGSKGIKNKNIQLLNGKPLLYYSVNVAKKFSKKNNIFVSTDSNRISSLAKKLGVSVIKRPKLISKDNSPEIYAWKHAIQYLHRKKIFFDTFLSLPTTSPLRSFSDIKKSIKLLKKNIDIVVTGSKSRRSPWYNMLKFNRKNGYAELLIKAKKKYKYRQSTPISFDMTTVCYVTRPSYILKSGNLLRGKVKICEIPEERALDIDSYYDLRLARLLTKDRK